MSQSLIDAHHRVIDYLRVSITDLCNLRCVYCRPPEGVKLITHDEILRYEEILFLVGMAVDMGIRKVRVTGGEPLVRRGVVDFLSKLARLRGLEDLGLTTNGVLLADMARDLKAAGLRRLNISLDSLRRDTFASITGGDHLDKVLSGIELALDLGFSPVKINVVLLKGVNEEDIPSFARLTQEKPVDVRFIERMPFGADPLPSAPDPFGAADALEMIRTQVGPVAALDRNRLDGPATMFRLAGAKGRIGIIDPITGHFCGTCNRLRLTARGTFRPCLLGSHEIDVREILRKGASREELEEVIRFAVATKPGGSGSNVVGAACGMNLIGG